MPVMYISYENAARLCHYERAAQRRRQLEPSAWEPHSVKDVFHRPSPEEPAERLAFGAPHKGSVLTKFPGPTFTWDLQLLSS